MSLNIYPGILMLAKPKNFQPRLRRTSTIGQHPVVVLSSPDENGLVMVASMSHRHPDDSPQQPTSTYNLPTQIHPVEGEGTINVGRPSLVHISKLKQTPMSTPTIMNASDLETLRTEIESHCPGLVFVR